MTRSRNVCRLAGDQIPNSHSELAHRLHPLDGLRPLRRLPARRALCSSPAASGRTISCMATRTIHLPESSYALLSAEAQRRGLDPDSLADELVRADLAAGNEQDLEAALKNLAEFRARLPEVDGIVLARDARAQLEQRGDS